MFPLYSIIFSKNRSAQLHCFLKSLRKQFREYAHSKFVVFYFCGSTDFELGYQEVACEFPEIQFEKQRPVSLFSQVLNLLDRNPAEYFSFFVDDNFFIRPFSLMDAPFIKLREDNDVTAVSLRLHPGITYCQPLSIPVPVPRLIENTYHWNHAAGDWAGPLSIDGNIVRFMKIRELFSSFPEFERIPAIEPLLNDRVGWGKKVAIYPSARLINIPLNRVDSFSCYPSGNSSAEDLNQEFLKGKRLSFEYSSLLHANACHVIIPVHMTS